MGTIEIISASAGSGKTYRLADELRAAIESGAARPDAVLAMTFTVKAAEELRHRARTHLLRAGRGVDAQRLAAARMGTVNAVCAALVGEFAFDLGLSPELRVLDEGAAEHALRAALSSAISPEVDETLAELAGRLDVPGRKYAYGPTGWDWAGDVDRVVQLARANDVPPAALRRDAARSVDGFHALLGPPAPDGAALDAQLASALADFLDAFDRGDDGTKKTADLARRARIAHRRLARGQPIRWDDWARLSQGTPGAKSRDAYAPVAAAAARHDVHPRLRADVDRAIEIVFELAARGLDRYERHKREHGVLDFVDQEALALKLLRRDDVRKRLRSRIDLVLVDEFQDTSPIQLAIFLCLADAAPRSVWVGDQKQAIYAFRGTDPALMDAVIDQILAGEEPRTLGTSWRSRPDLVDLTSRLFAPPFAARGIPETRVRLEPAERAEPPGLGPIVECWKLDAGKIEDDAAAVAAAVRDLLADVAARVRDPVTKEARGVRPADVAVLCRRNRIAEIVAAELEALGVRARLQRPGLLTTLEAGIVMAGLALWVDERDALGAAELARLTESPDDGDAWLAAALERGASEAFAGVPAVRGILAARAAHPFAGAIEALDRVIDLTAAAELCARWGDGARRLANLEALRRHADEHAGRCAEEGAACTPAALVRHLLELEREATDERGLARDEPAVAVGTWHGAKGLEWPITVLFELDDHPADLAAIGVHVECDRERIELRDPLAARWIRYWPFPLGYPARQGVPLRQRLAAHAVTARAMERADREELRLLYVGWTRARDRVALAGRAGRICAGTVARLNGDGGDAKAIAEPDARSGTSLTRAVWGGREIEIAVRAAAPSAPSERLAVAESAYPAGAPQPHPRAYVAPSDLEGRGEAGEAQRIGPRLAVHGTPDWAHLGSAIHGFLAADRPELEADVRRRVAERLIRAWGVAPALEPETLLAAGGRLRAWIDERWPGAAWRRELPVEGRRPDGSIVRGTADLVLETPDAIVVVDHKSFPGSTEQAVDRARRHAGQLHAYASIAAAARAKPVSGAFVHLPVSGLVVPTRS